MATDRNLAVSPLTEAGDQLAQRAMDGALARVPEEVRPVARAALAPWAEKLVRGLDDLIRIPGTKFGIGLDPIVGFFLPGAGDVITGTGSVALLFLALKERVPTVIILRMILNIAVDTVLGMLPFVGDAFDLFWRSNRRNLDLIERYKGKKEKPSTGDYVIVGFGVLLALLSIALPLFLIYVVGVSLVVALGKLGGE